jgi:hypothetical protein
MVSLVLKAIFVLVFLNNFVMILVSGPKYLNVSHSVHLFGKGRRWLGIILVFWIG